LAGHRFVAGSKAHHAVKLRALHRRFNLVRNKVAAAKDKPAFMPAVKEVNRGDSADFEGQPACLVDFLCCIFCDFIKMAVANRQIRRGVDDGYFRARHVLFPDAQSKPHGFSDRVVHFVTSVFLHVLSFLM
jgi:hypothetical protein